MKRVLLLTICAAVGCSSSQGSREVSDTRDPSPQMKQDTEAKKFEIHPGMSREAIERILGTPFAEEESMRGIEVSYMPGMGDIMRNMQGQMQAAQGAGRAMGILNSAAGIAGALGGPAGGMIAGAGTGIIDAGAAAFNTAAEPTMPDISNMEMFMVQYQNNIAVSVRRQNMGGIGEGQMNPE